MLRARSRLSASSSRWVEWARVWAGAIVGSKTSKKLKKKHKAQLGVPTECPSEGHPESTRHDRKKEEGGRRKKKREEK